MLALAGAIARAPRALPAPVPPRPAPPGRHAGRHGLRHGAPSRPAGDSLCRAARRPQGGFGPVSHLVTSAVHAAMASGMCAQRRDRRFAQPAFFHRAARSCRRPGRCRARARLGIEVLDAMCSATRRRAGELGSRRHGLSPAWPVVAHLRRHFARPPPRAASPVSASSNRRGCVLRGAAGSGISTWMRDRDHVEKAFALAE